MTVLNEVAVWKICIMHSFCHIKNLLRGIDLVFQITCVLRYCSSCLCFFDVFLPPPLKMIHLFLWYFPSFFVEMTYLKNILCHFHHLYQDTPDCAFVVLFRFSFCVTFLYNCIMIYNIKYT